MGTIVMVIATILTIILVTIAMVGMALLARRRMHDRYDNHNTAQRRQEGPGQDLGQNWYPGWQSRQVGSGQSSGRILDMPASQIPGMPVSQIMSTQTVDYVYRTDGL